MEVHLKIVGALLILLAGLHAAFPRYFRWREELSGVLLFTRQLVYVHTFFIGFVVFLMGLLCLVEADQLLKTILGHDILIGLFAFWGVRLIFQLFVYSPELWRGKRFETMVHIVFSLLWTYISGVLLLAFIR